MVRANDGEPTNLFMQTIEPGVTFFNDAGRLIRKCTKPDAKEMVTIARYTSIGFLAMGGLGFAIKLVFIPLNNWLIGG